MVILYFVIIFILFLVMFSSLFFLSSSLFSIMFGAPYVPISQKYIRKILSFGSLSSNDILYDLGCGNGRILITGISDFNISKAVGYEISPWPYFKTIYSIKKNKIKRIEVFRKNCLKADISQATFIYLYLFPALVDKVAYKIAKEGARKTKILCVSFPIDLNKHTRFQLLKSEKLENLTLYLYELNMPIIY